MGCSASLRGTLVDSPGKGQAKEFRAEWVEVLGESDAEVRCERFGVLGTELMVRGTELPDTQHEAGRSGGRVAAERTLAASRERCCCDAEDAERDGLGCS